MKANWESERDPLAALQAGSRGLFEAFIETETITFLGFFGRLGANPAEAEDLVQELALKLYSTAKTYQPQGRFSSYVYRAARNLWIDATRRRQRGPRQAPVSDFFLEGHEDPRAVRPEDALTGSEEVARLRVALASLPQSQRLVFELGVMQELPYLEISQLLEIPVGTVKSRMFHAVRKLREQLQAEPPESSGGTSG